MRVTPSQRLGEVHWPCHARQRLDCSFWPCVGKTSGQRCCSARSERRALPFYWGFQRWGEDLPGQLRTTGNQRWLTPTLRRLPLRGCAGEWLRMIPSGNFCC